MTSNNRLRLTRFRLTLTRFLREASEDPGGPKTAAPTFCTPATIPILQLLGSPQFEASLVVWPRSRLSLNRFILLSVWFVRVVLMTDHPYGTLRLPMRLDAQSCLLLSMRPL